MFIYYSLLPLEDNFPSAYIFFWYIWDTQMLQE